MLSLQGLHLRATLFHLFRTFFNKNGFLEVDTPIRQPLLLPEDNIVPVRSEGWFLQTSPELYMKRLLATGCEKIFQICRCFRSEEQGRMHLQEFVMVEWYRTGEDYFTLMKDCEQLLGFIAKQLKKHLVGTSSLSKESIFSEGFTLTGPYDKLRVKEAFSRYCPLPMEQALRDDCFDELLVEYIEPNLGFKRPLFLYDYPAELGSLAKLNEQDETVAERFELYIKGVELANGFSELTDASEQRLRFEKAFAHLNRDGLAWEMPETFLRELGKIEKAAGIALGFDRLLMLVMDKETIGDIIPFSDDEL